MRVDKSEMGVVTPIGLALFVVALICFSQLMPIYFEAVGSMQLPDTLNDFQKLMLRGLASMLPAFLLLVMVVWWLVYANYG